MSETALVGWSVLTGAKNTPYSISNLLNNSTITTGANGTADAIQKEAFDMIWRRLRHWQMMPAPATGSLTIGNDYTPLPSDMLEPSYFALTGTNSQQIIQKTYQEVIGSWAFDQNGNRIQQQPLIYYFDQANFRFDSPADQAYPYSLLYYQQPATLSATNNSNFICVTALRLLKAAIMLAATEWTKEQGSGQYPRTYWAEIFEQEADKVQTESDRARRATSTGAAFSGNADAGSPIYAVW